MNEPFWKEYLPVKAVDDKLGVVLGDIESHLPHGHPYKDADKITYAHECSHGINSNIRNKYSNLGKINAFYCLQNRAIVLKEPDITLAKVARAVPDSLRGSVYRLYLINQQRYWNHEPLYVLDEFDSYINGSVCRLDLKIENRAESVRNMAEFNVYSICLSQLFQPDLEFKNFLIWQLERAMSIYQQSLNLGDISAATEYLNIFKTNKDASSLRQFTREYFGEEWTKELFGF